METQTRKTNMNYLVASVQEGMPVNPSKLCATLREEGLDFDERVNYLYAFYKATEGMVKRNVELCRTHFNEHPELAKKYSRKYKLEEFIPGLGLLLNSQRNERLREEHRLFYRWANDKNSSSLLERAFTAYHYMSTSLTLYSIFQMLK